MLAGHTITNVGPVGVFITSQEIDVYLARDLRKKTIVGTDK